MHIAPLSPDDPSELSGYDDLDGGAETLAGFRSVLSGGLPAGHPFPDWAHPNPRRNA